MVQAAQVKGSSNTQIDQQSSNTETSAVDISKIKLPALDKLLLEVSGLEPGTNDKKGNAKLEISRTPELFSALFADNDFVVVAESDRALYFDSYDLRSSSIRSVILAPETLKTAASQGLKSIYLKLDSDLSEMVSAYTDPNHPSHHKVSIGQIRNRFLEDAKEFGSIPSVQQEYAEIMTNAVQNCAKFNIRIQGLPEIEIIREPIATKYLEWSKSNPRIELMDVEDIELREELIKGRISYLAETVALQEGWAKAISTATGKDSKALILVHSPDHTELLIDQVTDETDPAYGKGDFDELLTSVSGRPTVHVFADMVSAPWAGISKNVSQDLMKNKDVGDVVVHTIKERDLIVADIQKLLRHDLNAQESEQVLAEISKVLELLHDYNVRLDEDTDTDLMNKAFHGKKDEFLLCCVAFSEIEQEFSNGENANPAIIRDRIAEIRAAGKLSMGAFQKRLADYNQDNKVLKPEITQEQRLFGALMKHVETAVSILENRGFYKPQPELEVENTPVKLDASGRVQESMLSVVGKLVRRYDNIIFADTDHGQTEIGRIFSDIPYFCEMIRAQGGQHLITELPKSYQSQIESYSSQAGTAEERVLAKTPFVSYVYEMSAQSSPGETFKWMQSRIGLLERAVRSGLSVHAVDEIPSHDLGQMFKNPEVLREFKEERKAVTTLWAERANELKGKKVFMVGAAHSNESGELQSLLDGKTALVNVRATKYFAPSVIKGGPALLELDPETGKSLELDYAKPICTILRRDREAEKDLVSRLERVNKQEVQALRDAIFGSQESVSLLNAMVEEANELGFAKEAKLLGELRVELDAAGKHLAQNLYNEARENFERAQGLLSSVGLSQDLPAMAYLGALLKRSNTSLELLK